MTRSEEWWRGFGPGMAVGAVLAAAIVGGFAIWEISRVKEIFTQIEATEVVHKQNDAKIEQALKGCLEDSKDLYSQATLLMEPQASPQTALFGLALDALAPGLGRALAQTDKSGRAVPRWYIPLKVKPVVYGDAQGATYLWFDRRTKELSGPFAPENQR